MNVLVSASTRVAATGDGELWTANGSLGHGFWRRYLDVFDEVRLLVRAVPVESPPSGWNRVTGPRVKSVPLPDFRSLGGFARAYPQVKRLIRSSLSNNAAVALRLPCPVGDIVWRSMGDRPYGVEVVGDPYDTFSPGAVTHRLRPLFRWWFPRQLQRQCVGACANAYVTERALQSRYPSCGSAFSTHYSSVELGDSDFVSGPRAKPARVKPIRLITVGSLAHRYKAPELSIEAVARCASDGLDLELVLVGDGKHRLQLEARVAAAGLSSKIRFLGQLSAPAALRQQLDQAALFILPSRQEGLPKAMIEAMARGLPCLGSNVGGIPELLPTEDLVAPNDAVALAAKIREVIGDGDRLGRMSARNLKKAREYRSELLRTKRVDFYRYLKERTEKWTSTRRTTSTERLLHSCSEGKVT